ncbi:MAG: hypothetical protein Q7T41_04110 [Candidatus Saccharibacteria bacterium]|nr:hypothetical protein [Candidatus Saccharibacteria bacterium]
MTDVLERTAESNNVSGILPVWLDTSYLYDEKYFASLEDFEVDELLAIGNNLLEQDPEEYDDLDNYLQALSCVAIYRDDYGPTYSRYRGSVSLYAQLSEGLPCATEAMNIFLSDYLWWWPSQDNKDEAVAQDQLNDTARKLILRDPELFIQGIVDIKGPALLYTDKVIEKLLTPFGFSSEQAKSMFAAYNAHYEEGQSDSIMFEKLVAELQNITYIYDQDPEMLQQLYSRFGIRNFGRYDADILIQQLKPNSFRSGPKVLSLISTFDWNGHSIGAVGCLESASESLDADVVYYEVVDVFSAVRAARDFAKNGGKADYVVLTSHGSEMGLEISDKEDIVLIEQRDLRLAGKLASMCAKESATVILTGCSTDADKSSFAEQLRIATGLKVRAPKGQYAAVLYARKNGKLSVRYYK